MNTPILTVKNLHIVFQTQHGPVQVADEIGFAIHEKETFCLLGESGCGKSVIALSILRLLPENAVVSGEIIYKGHDLAAVSSKQLPAYRGTEIAMIFEQPASCLNPVMRIGEQLAEVYRAQGCSNREAKVKAHTKLAEVGISPRRYSAYPHELSGGMQQRVMIALAIACEPALLIADEPTTSQDVTIQRQILDLLGELQDRYKMALLLITHDLGVVAEMADTVGVMYAGYMMEIANVGSFFKETGHPYANALRCLFVDGHLNPIAGNVPNLSEKSAGCPFFPRCPEALAICAKYKPGPKFVRGKMQRCHRD
jgi:peptide/nickel transport system ATP-binding protein